LPLFGYRNFFILMIKEQHIRVSPHIGSALFDRADPSAAGIATAPPLPAAIAKVSLPDTGVWVRAMMGLLK
jgi:hypothetical protein